MDSDSRNKMEMYHRLEVIGEGSFGRVYKGRRRYTGQVVALKFIPKVGREGELEGLRREIAILERLDHPNIIMLLDWFETEHEICVVTEVAQGDLQHALKEDACFPENVIRRIAADIVSALHYLHSQGITHRDMKPANLLIAANGRVKLCDFGFARAFASQSFVMTSQKGTPLYMAPEVILAKPYDSSVDLWSLGVILYELFVGQSPFFTRSLVSMVNGVLKKVVEFPLEMSDPLKDLLTGLLQKDASKRLGFPHLLEHPFIASHMNNSTKCSLEDSIHDGDNALKQMLREKYEAEVKLCADRLHEYRDSMRHLRLEQRDVNSSPRETARICDITKMGWHDILCTCRESFDSAWKLRQQSQFQDRMVNALNGRDPELGVMQALELTKLIFNSNVDRHKDELSRPLAKKDATFVARVSVNLIRVFNKVMERVWNRDARSSNISNAYDVLQALIDSCSSLRPFHPIQINKFDKDMVPQIQKLLRIEALRSGALDLLLMLVERAFPSVKLFHSVYKLLAEHGIVQELVTADCMEDPKCIRLLSHIIHAPSLRVVAFPVTGDRTSAQQLPSDFDVEDIFTVSEWITSCLTRTPNHVHRLMQLIVSRNDDENCDEETSEYLEQVLRLVLHAIRRSECARDALASEEFTHVLEHLAVLAAEPSRRWICALSLLILDTISRLHQMTAIDVTPLCEDGMWSRLPAEVILAVLATSTPHWIPSLSNPGIPWLNCPRAMEAIAALLCGDRSQSLSWVKLQQRLDGVAYGFNMRGYFDAAALHLLQVASARQFDLLLNEQCHTSVWQPLLERFSQPSSHGNWISIEGAINLLSMMSMVVVAASLTFNARYSPLIVGGVLAMLHMDRLERIDQWPMQLGGGIDAVVHVLELALNVLYSVLESAKNFSIDMEHDRSRIIKHLFVDEALGHLLNAGIKFGSMGSVRVLTLRVLVQLVCDFDVDFGKSYLELNGPARCLSLAKLHKESNADADFQDDECEEAMLHVLQLLHSAIRMDKEGRMAIMNMKDELCTWFYSLIEYQRDDIASSAIHLVAICSRNGEMFVDRNVGDVSLLDFVVAYLSHRLLDVRRYALLSLANALFLEKSLANRLSDECIFRIIEALSEDDDRLRLNAAAALNNLASTCNQRALSEMIRRNLVERLCRVLVSSREHHALIKSTINALRSIVRHAPTARSQLLDVERWTEILRQIALDDPTLEKKCLEIMRDANESQSKT